MLTAIVGTNWGDEGKGRMVDLLSSQYDIVCRYQGGNNAGHTVVNEKGKGNAARWNGVPGDIHVYIEEEPHSELLRDGQNLQYNLLLDVPTAILGGTAEVPTIDGKVKIKIDK